MLLEAVLAIAVFSIFLVGIGFSLVLGERSTLLGGDRIRAAFLAEEQLEAIRGIRNDNFNFVTPGTHGLIKTATGWLLSGTGTSNSGYRSRLEIISRGPGWLEVTAKITWSFDQSRTGTSSLTTYLTDWRKVSPVGNWGAMSLLARSDLSGSPELQKIAIGDNYIYITGSRISGGKGLYVYNVSNPAAPVQIAAAFDLGASAFGVAINGNYLYLATDDPSGEVKVYDVSNPELLSPMNLVSVFDLPGSGKARSIAVSGDTVFVGTLDEPLSDQFYALHLNINTGLTQLDSINLTGSVLDIKLRGHFDYVATSNNSAELAVVDISDPAHLRFAPGIGVDLTDTQDATSVLTTGTAALVGRFEGTAIDELQMFSIENSPVPSGPPGPWNLEIGGDVRSLDSTFTRYGFVAGNADAAQLKVIDLIKLERNEAPVLKSYDALAAINGIVYDWQKDRLFAVTPSSLLIFAPGP